MGRRSTSISPMPRASARRPAAKRLNAITAQLAKLDFAKAPVFTMNGLKREQLIAVNSMILHELYFDGLGGAGAPSGT